MSDSEHFEETDSVIYLSTNEEHYLEEDCMTDDEEEVSHDHICCSACGHHTHVAVGKCSNPTCGTEFKFSSSGYLISGEDDGFICDDGLTEMEEDSDEDEDEESIGTSDEDDDSDGDSDSDSEIVFDDEIEYTPKIDLSSISSMPRRQTRSMKIN